MSEFSPDSASEGYTHYPWSLNMTIMPRNVFIEGARWQYEQDKARIAGLVEALKFECGGRCAQQNPCSAREAIEKFGGEE